MQVVVVKFKDPTTFGHWETKEELDKSKCKVCFACGFLLEENTTTTKVALLCAEDLNSFSDWIDIPAGCILSCEVIKEVDWERPNV
mgnify:CR=1 FL=1